MGRQPATESNHVKMVRQHLEQIPEFSLPSGFSLRLYQTGDIENWLRIQKAADLHTKDISHELFRHYFGSDDSIISQRQLFLIDSHQRAIGTATAWFDDSFQGERFGRVHWVAIIPEFQGRGLARPLMTAVCKKLRELAHERVYLSTSAERFTAIRLYLRFGFVPLISSEEEKAAWDRLQKASQHARHR